MIVTFLNSSQNGSHVDKYEKLQQRLRDKLENLDNLILQIQTNQDDCSEYMEKLKLLEDKKKARIETSLKRKQLQIQSINEEYVCQKTELEACYDYEKHQLQDTFDKRRRLINLDAFLQNAKSFDDNQSEDSFQSQSSNWLDADLKGIKALTN